MNRKKLNILVVVESLDINDSSATKGRVALINNLHASGFNLKVYHYTRKDIQLKGIDCVPIPEKKCNFWYFLSRSQRIFTRITKLNINPFIEKLFGFSFTFFNDVNSIKTALKKENEFQPTWVLTLSKAASFRSHGALLGIPKWHSKWLAYIHDPYPMHSYPRPYDWVEPGHQKKRDFFLQIADKSQYAIYPSMLLGDWMEGYYEPLKGKAVVIPHQISIPNTDKTQILPFFEESNFNILQAGALFWGRNPQGLLEGFKLFLLNCPEATNEARLIFVGSKNHYTALLENYSDKISQLYISEDYVPFLEVFKMQKMAAVNVILEAKGTLSPFLPGKFPHCVAANKPILLLGPYYSECKRIVGDEYSFTSTIDDEKEISKHIERLYKTWKFNNGSLFLNRPDIEEYLSKNHLLETMNKLKCK